MTGEGILVGHLLRIFQTKTQRRAKNPHTPQIVTPQIHTHWINQCPRMHIVSDPYILFYASLADHFLYFESWSSSAPSLSSPPARRSLTPRSATSSV